MKSKKKVHNFYFSEIEFYVPKKAPPLSEILTGVNISLSDLCY